MHAYVRRVSTITQRGLADGLQAEHREGNARVATINKHVLNDPMHVRRNKRATPVVSSRVVCWASLPHALRHILVRPSTRGDAPR